MLGCPGGLTWKRTPEQTFGEETRARPLGKGFQAEELSRAQITSLFGGHFGASLRGAKRARGMVAGELGLVRTQAFSPLRREEAGGSRAEEGRE